MERTRFHGGLTLLPDWVTEVPFVFVRESRIVERTVFTNDRVIISGIFSDRFRKVAENRSYLYGVNDHLLAIGRCTTS